MQTTGKLSGPLVAVFAVDRQRVFSRDGEQPFYNDARVLADETRVGNHGERLAEQWREPKFAAEAVQRRTSNILTADQRAEDASNNAFAAARRADHEQDFVQLEPSA